MWSWGDCSSLSFSPIKDIVYELKMSKMPIFEIVSSNTSHYTFPLFGDHNMELVYTLLVLLLVLVISPVCLRIPKRMRDKISVRLVGGSTTRPVMTIKRGDLSQLKRLLAKRSKCRSNEIETSIPYLKTTAFGEDIRVLSEGTGGVLEIPVLNQGLLMNSAD